MRLLLGIFCSGQESSRQRKDELMAYSDSYEGLGIQKVNPAQRWDPGLV